MFLDDVCMRFMLKNKNKQVINCFLFCVGIWAGETCPQRASVPVQWIERDAKTKWRAAKCEFLLLSVDVQKLSLLCKTGVKKTAICQFKRLHVEFHSFLFFVHTVDMHALCFFFCFLSLHLELYLPSLLFRRSVSCVSNRRVLLEKYLTCRRPWSGRIKKLRYGLWALVQQVQCLLCMKLNASSYFHFSSSLVHSSFHFPSHSVTWGLHSGLRATERIHRRNPNWARWAQRRSGEAERHSKGTQCVNVHICLLWLVLGNKSESLRCENKVLMN